MSLLFLSLKVVTGFIKSGFIINSLSNSTVCGSAVKNLPANAGDTGLNSRSGESPEEGNNNPL